jgi:hypothetical protein
MTFTSERREPATCVDSDFLDCGLELARLDDIERPVISTSAWFQ